MSAVERQLRAQLRKGGERALAGLFVQYRDQLHRLIEMRLDPRLHSRVDASDVLQESFLDASHRLWDYLDRPKMHFFSWLRFLVCQRLAAVHRWHFRRRKRDPRQETSLSTIWRDGPDSKGAVGEPCAADTPPSGAAIRLELVQTLHAVLDRLEPADREILVLRHFEELTNGQAAAKLGLTKAAASKRYTRALGRFKDVALPMLEAGGWD